VFDGAGEGAAWGTEREGMLVERRKPRVDDRLYHRSRRCVVGGDMGVPRGRKEGGNVYMESLWILVKEGWCSICGINVQPSSARR